MCWNENALPLVAPPVPGEPEPRYIAQTALSRGGSALVVCAYSCDKAQVATTVKVGGIFRYEPWPAALAGAGAALIVCERASGTKKVSKCI